jgi:hypothetical protein
MEELMNTEQVRFPAGGSRTAVYDFMQRNGFQMSGWSDKVWTDRSGLEVHIYGAGSQARITHNDKLVADGPLEYAVNQAISTQD